MWSLLCLHLLLWHCESFWLYFDETFIAANDSFLRTCPEFTFHDYSSLSRYIYGKGNTVFTFVTKVVKNSVKKEIKVVCKYNLIRLRLKLKETRRDRLKSAPYLRLKNIQRTTIGNIWKNFFKKIFWIFFSKKVFFKKSHNAENSKRGHSGSLNVFTNRKLRKIARGYPLIESENFRKKVT